jgi:hypothetical protein
MVHHGVTCVGIVFAHKVDFDDAAAGTFHRASFTQFEWSLNPVVLVDANKNNDGPCHCVFGCFPMAG